MKKEKYTAEETPKKRKNRRAGIAGAVLVAVLALACVLGGVFGQNDLSALSGAAVRSGEQASQTDGQTSADSVTTPNGKITPDGVPAFADSPYIAVDGNIPSFTEQEKSSASAFEQYSALDALGRCGTAFACVGKETMPTDDRGSIGDVQPSGWHSVKYDCVDGKYLYNRCHLIGYQLTAENANARNLITGTRYLNIEGMLPLENMVADYITETENHVLYRVTPVFDGSDLVCRGVQMEAWSVEDGGDGICFNVYCYNVQPGVVIDYSTGDSRLEDDEAAGTSAAAESTKSSAKSTTKAAAKTTAASADRESSVTVYRTSSGKRYHLDPDCGGKNSYAVSLQDAKDAGLTPCQKCAQS